MKAREKKKERKERKKQKKKMKKLRKLSEKDTPLLPLDPQMPPNKLSCSLEMWQTEGPVEHGPGEAFLQTASRVRIISNTSKAKYSDGVKRRLIKAAVRCR